MNTDLDHLSPGIKQVIAAFEADDFSTIRPVFGERGLGILKRWWCGEDMGIVRIVGDIRSPGGVLGEETILRQARCAQFRVGADVLDIACGIGGPSRALARHFSCKVHGVDLDADSIVVACGLSKIERLEDLTTFQVADRTSLPVNDGNYDLVWGHGGWGSGDDYRKTWAEGFRAVRSGGQVCCNGVSRDALEWIKGIGFTDIQFHEYYGQVRRETLQLFLYAMDKQKQQIVGQAGEHVWTMFHDQKARQLSELDGQDLGVVVATK